MALDCALLEALAAGPERTGPAPVLRFYSWEAPTLSFGRMQRPPQDLLRRCRELGVPAVRRPTGGKAILHDREVTFSITAPAAGLGSVMESYRIFARAIAAGLRALGVEADLCETRASSPQTALLCFGDPAGCDLQARGRKLVGSAQARRGGVLLQQNCLPLRLSVPAPAAAGEPQELKQRLFGAAAAREARRATDLASLMGGEPLFARVRDAVVAGFRAELGIRFEPGTPTADETAAAHRLRPASVLPDARLCGLAGEDARPTICCYDPNSTIASASSRR
jgi:lipoate-protein ligase A